jgi:hypothetical protein
MSRFFPVSEQGRAIAEKGQTKGGVGFDPTEQQRPVRLNVFRLYLDAANTSKRLNIGGNGLWCVNASSMVAVAKIAFEDPGGEIPFLLGTSVRPGPFSRIFVTNDAQSGDWLDLAYIGGGGKLEIENPAKVYDNRPSKLNPLDDVTIAATSSGKLVDQNYNRQSLMIENLASNADAIRIGDDTVSGSKGLSLSPGQIMTIETTAEIHAYNTAGSGADIALLEFVY